MSNLRGCSVRSAMRSLPPMSTIKRLREVAETLRQVAASLEPAPLRIQIDALAEQCEAVASAADRALLRQALSKKPSGS